MFNILLQISMEETIITELLKLGAVGVMLLGLGSYAKQQIQANAAENEKMKQTIIENLERQVEQNETLEKDFREYLKQRNHELSQIIEKNTAVLEQVLKKLS